jgi:hypothetical protein
VNAHRCCEVAASDSKRETIAAPTMFTRRCRDIAGWMVPSAILVLLPKCPMCLAAYLAFGTGVGLSISTATYVRMLLVVICILSLSFFAAKHIASRYARRSIKRTPALAIGRLDKDKGAVVRNGREVAN